MPAVTTTAAPSTSSHAPRRRPLLDLFPPTPLDGESRPTPIGGEVVAPPPPLAPVVERQRPPDAAEQRAAPRRAERVAVPPQPPEEFETFYGLRESAFGASTDPAFVFPSVEHERAAHETLTALSDQQAIVLLTGEPGIGKTTACRTVLRQLDRRTISSLVTTPTASIDDLLATLLVDFGVVSRADAARPHAPGSLGKTLESFLGSLAPLHAKAVVVVDDAEKQPGDVLAAVGQLGANAESLQIVLTGTGGLASRLKEEGALHALDEAIGVRLEHGPLRASEVVGYVSHRIEAAGPSARVEFSEAAIARLFELSRGVPAVVNALCERALRRGFEQAAATIDATLVDAAAPDDEAFAPVERPSRARAAAIAGCLLALAIAGGAAALWVFHDAVARTVIQWERVPPAPGGPVLRRPAPLAPIPPP